MRLIEPEYLDLYPVEHDLDQDQVSYLIEVASAEVIDAAGSPILKRTSTIELSGTSSGLLQLPGLPVRKVFSIVTETGKPITDYRRIASGVFRFKGWPAETLTITYEHGLDKLPADIGDLVARMVIAGIHAMEDEELAMKNGRLSSIAVDDYKEAYNTTAIDAVTEMNLPQATRERLAKRFGGRGAHVGKTL